VTLVIHDIQYHSMQRQHYVSTLSIPLSALMSVPWQSQSRTIAVGQHAIRAGESIPVPTWQNGLARRRASRFPCKNGIVHREGKSIIQMLLLGIKWRGRSLYLSSCYLTYLLVTTIGTIWRYTIADACLPKQAVRLGGRHNMPPPLLTVGQRVCKFKGVSKEILRVF